MRGEHKSSPPGCLTDAPPSDLDPCRCPLPRPVGPPDPTRRTPPWALRAAGRSRPRAAVVATTAPPGPPRRPPPPRPPRAPAPSGPLGAAAQARRRWRPPTGAALRGAPQRLRRFGLRRRRRPRRAEQRRGSVRAAAQTEREVGRGGGGALWGVDACNSCRRHPLWRSGALSETVPQCGSGNRGGLGACPTLPHLQCEFRCRGFELVARCITRGVRKGGDSGLGEPAGFLHGVLGTFPSAHARMSCSREQDFSWSPTPPCFCQAPFIRSFIQRRPLLATIGVPGRQPLRSTRIPGPTPLCSRADALRPDPCFSLGGRPAPAATAAARCLRSAPCPRRSCAAMRRTQARLASAQSSACRVGFWPAAHTGGILATHGSSRKSACGPRWGSWCSCWAPVSDCRVAVQEGVVRSMERVRTTSDSVQR